jgi:NAD+ synthase (glutamine-hydrolysing)
MKTYDPKESFIRVATGTPIVHIADCKTNSQQLLHLYKQAVTNTVSIIAFPELCITSYSLGDIVRQHTLLDQALVALEKLAKATKNQPTAMIVGLPYKHENRLYNCAAFLLPDLRLQL